MKDLQADLKAYLTTSRYYVIIEAAFSDSDLEYAQAIHDEIGVRSF